MAKAKKPKRNNSHKWHRHQRGGKTFAERRGTEMKIAKLETEISECEAKIEKVEQLMSFTRWWHDGTRVDKQK